jgi:hypothetical protein
VQSVRGWGQPFVLQHKLFDRQGSVSRCIIVVNQIIFYFPFHRTFCCRHHSMFVQYCWSTVCPGEWICVAQPHVVRPWSTSSWHGCLQCSLTSMEVSSSLYLQYHLYTCALCLHLCIFSTTCTLVLCVFIFVSSVPPVCLWFVSSSLYLQYHLYACDLCLHLCIFSTTCVLVICVFIFVSSVPPVHLCFYNKASPQALHNMPYVLEAVSPIFKQNWCRFFVLLYLPLQ